MRDRSSVCSAGSENAVAAIVWITLSERLSVLSAGNPEKTKGCTTCRWFALRSACSSSYSGVYSFVLLGREAAG